MEKHRSPSKSSPLDGIRRLLWVTVKLLYTCEVKATHRNLAVSQRQWNLREIASRPMAGGASESSRGDCLFLLSMAHPLLYCVHALLNRAQS